MPRRRVLYDRENYSKVIRAKWSHTCPCRVWWVHSYSTPVNVHTLFHFLSTVRCSGHCSEKTFQRMMHECGHHNDQNTVHFIRSWVLLRAKREQIHIDVETCQKRDEKMIYQFRLEVFFINLQTHIGIVQNIDAFVFDSSDANYSHRHGPNRHAYISLSYTYSVHTFIVSEDFSINYGFTCIRSSARSTLQFRFQHESQHFTASAGPRQWSIS